MKRWLFVVGLAAGSAGIAACLDDPDLDDTAFPCRAVEDCVDGYVCHPERWVCVPEGEAPAIDAGTLDAG